MPDLNKAALQLACAHTSVNWRINRSQPSGEIACRLTVRPVCCRCGVPLHFESVETSTDQTTLMARLVPGVGAVPVE